MSLNLLWLLLPIAAASGWYVARQEYQRKFKEQSYELPQDYYKGLNYILNEQPDKAIDVFLKLSELDNNAAEVHLALGSLFRRRGEVDRAIRIHQGLVDRVSLSVELHNQALQELAQDYMSAGLLDRAENLCLELVDANAGNLAALRLLQDIYQQEKEWFRAIDVVRKIGACSGESVLQIIAHYYCELAEIARAKGDIPQAMRMLEKVMQEYPSCGRAAIISGNIALESGDFKVAIKSYQSIEDRSPVYLSEIINSLQDCYAATGDESELVDYLRRIVRDHHGVELILKAAHMVREHEGDEAALQFLAEEVNARPSLKGVQYLLELDLLKLDDQDSLHLRVVKNSLDKLLANKPVYRCNSCGFTGMEMHWCCPSCKRWSSIQPIQEFQWGASI
jgi:lipopolysaccharide biosynthesis regulator YciM